MVDDILICLFQSCPTLWPMFGGEKEPVSLLVDIPVLRKPWLESMVLLRCQDAKANESSGLGFPWLCDARSMCLLTCRFTRDSSTNFFPKVVGYDMVWHGMLKIEIPTSLGIVYSFSTAPMGIQKNSNHPIVDQKIRHRPGSQGQNERPRHRVSGVFLCRPSWPSHFLGQLWPRSSKKNKCGGSKPWLNESLPPKKDTTQMKPWFSSGSIAELGSHMEGMSYDICSISPFQNMVFTNKQRMTSPFQNAPFLSPIFSGYDAPFFFMEKWRPLHSWGIPRSGEARRLGEVGREGLRRSQGAADFMGILWFFSSWYGHGSIPMT